ncbi:chitin-binding domain protein cbd-1-like [Rhopilema esculentum]|uniref:chitin-binding domain protein cbd-1-like n=1 Tax=Rhopilema esculentum TaxID=499914 RepID=UPI0031D25D9D
MKTVLALAILAVAIIGSECRHLQKYPGYLCKYPGHYAYPKSCEKFIQCDAHGNAFIMPCAPGTVFNPYISVCVHKNKYSCGAYKPGYYGGKHPYHGYLCKRPGHYAHPYSCTKFVQCDNHGNAFVKHCSYGTVFNPYIQVCDHPYNYPKCGYYKHGYKKDYGYKKGPCAYRHGALLPYKPNCHYFIHCSHGIGYVKACPSNLVWNPKIKACDWYKKGYYYNHCHYYGKHYY